MRSVNKVIVIGHLTRDPEIRVTASGHKVATFSLATNRVWKDSNGAKHEATDYIDCVAWSTLAEIMSKYVFKGQAVYIEGQLRTRSWEAPDGTKRHKTEVHLNDLNILTWSEGKEKSEDYAETTTTKKTEPEEKTETKEEPTEDLNIDDIPF